VGASGSAYFPVEASLLRPPIAAPRVGEQVLKDPFKPRPQLGWTSPTQLRDVAAGGQERVLDQVRGAHLRRQVGRKIALCHQDQIVAKEFKLTA
jgi:hypothetical protein